MRERKMKSHVLRGATRLGWAIGPVWRMRGWRLSFASRLILALAPTLAVVSGLAYFEVARTTQSTVIEQETVYQRAQVHAMEATIRGKPLASAIAEIDRLIDTTPRTGTHETLLIDPRSRIVATSDDALLGLRNSDTRIQAALAKGTPYAGREADPRRDTRDFEFVTPLRINGHRFAFEATFDHAVFDERVAAARRSFGLIALFGLLGGSVVFYLAGGRSLVRSHRRALERATLDGLTDLGNQRAFQGDLERAVALAGRQGEALALALIDIDDFKFLNDRRGHAHGDELLLRFADVLRNGRVSDRAYRVGGDEFALLLPATDIQGATVVLRRLMRDLAEAQLTVSTGINALRPGEDQATLRDEVDAALGEAKRRGGNALVGYEEIRDSVSITTGVKVQALHRLLDERDMSVAFQPIWNLDGGSLLGVEALARPAARYGFSGPAEAFDIAEQLGRVRELDMLCVQRILAQADELPDGALLFMNIAPRTLDLEADGDGWLVAAIERSGIGLGRVVIEVTERFGGRMSSVVKSLGGLGAAGLRLALDDVGAGNSGLEMLRRVAFEFVKIDRSIVVGAMSEPGARAVLLAIATYANETGSYVIAEGIEDNETLGFVRHLEDDLTVARPHIQGGQGYGLGRPDDAMPRPGNDALSIDAVLISS
jgi:diguanylate cyclase (GGDEF)-like protein